MNNQAESVVDAQLDNLLQVVERNRDERCRQLLDTAHAQARQLLQQAYREARERLHHKVLATREEARRQLASAQAQQQTRLRLQRHHADEVLLARGTADAFALRHKFHDPAVAARYMPQGQMAQDLYEAMVTSAPFSMWYSSMWLMSILWMWSPEKIAT